MIKKKKIQTHKYNIYENLFWIKSSNLDFLKLVKKQWAPFYTGRNRDKPKVLFEVIEGSAENFKYNRIFFDNGHCLFLTGPAHCVVGYFYKHPWQIYIQTFGSQNLQLLYFYLFEPLLLSALKRLNLFLWHSAAVAKDGNAVLLAGPSGSGKTTTALNFLRNGFNILSDDTVFLSKNKTHVYAQGRERNLFVTLKTISFFPELEILKSTPNHKKGDRLKKKLEVNRLYPKQVAEKAKVKMVLFPKITRNQKTTLKSLSRKQAMIQCLKQKPKEHPGLIKDKIAIEQQILLYATLTQSAKCYDLLLGKEPFDLHLNS